VAEELKSWNLLTRTGQHFEFINWKLTFFWLLGCFVRQGADRCLSSTEAEFNF
jgi:hypothetical protein